MEMTTPIAVLTAITLAVSGGFAWYLGWAQKKIALLERQLQQPSAGTTSANPLVLNAYERLTLLVERCKIPNLINRLYAPDMTARDMQQAILQALRQEFEHNITQQLYVASQIWEAVSRMKDQNGYLVNQLAALLPAQATALDLNKKLLDFALSNPDATLNEVILEAVQAEAKKLL
jgi:hypothetical protein